MRRLLALVTTAVVAFGSACASAAPSGPAWNLIPAVRDPSAIPLYDGGTPAASGEIWFKFEGQVVSVRNVTRPTLSPVLPSPGKATGAAVIVAPGGAFEFLSIDHEGWKIAQALAEKGVTVFVLKYRLRPTPVDQDQWRAALMEHLAVLRAKDAARPALDFPDATADALAAVALVRSDAARWGVDPHRVGMIGFSAGAAATLSAVLTAKPGQGPDFFGLLYGPMPRAEVPPNAPPLFAAIAADDPYFDDTSLIQAWRAAQRPAELHVYQGGGHGFGLGQPGTTNALWMDEFTAWLSMQGFLKRTNAAASTGHGQ